MLWFSMTVSFLIAALSGMGVGGGGLFMIYLSLFTNTPQLAAQGINLLFFLFSAGASVLIHLQKRQIFFGTVGIMAVSGMLGSLLGVEIATLIHQELLRKFFGILLVISGILALRQKAIPPAPSNSK